jgi:AAA+ ATPase superfamily predicted ATPase
LISNRNTTAKPSFFCNNLFVFDSKISGEQESNIFQKNASIFDSMNIKRSFLIRHVPCSFDCNDSIEIGKKTLRLLKRHSPDLAGKIVDALKKPVLYWNYFEWIVLNGSAERRVLVYDSILGFESLIGNDIKKMVLSGNKVKIMDDNLSIFRGSEKIGDIPVKNGLPLCIDFQ